MNTQQQIILWTGLILTLVYLFTDKSFHKALTTTSSAPGKVQDVDFLTNAPAPSGTQLV